MGPLEHYTEGPLQGRQLSQRPHGKREQGGWTQHKEVGLGAPGKRPPEPRAQELGSCSYQKVKLVFHIKQRYLLRSDAAAK